MVQVEHRISHQELTAIIMDLDNIVSVFEEVMKHSGLLRYYGDPVVPVPTDSMERLIKILHKDSRKLRVLRDELRVDDASHRNDE